MEQKIANWVAFERLLRKILNLFLFGYKKITEPHKERNLCPFQDNYNQSVYSLIYHSLQNAIKHTQNNGKITI